MSSSMIGLVNRGAVHSVAGPKSQAARSGQNATKVRKNIAKTIRRDDDIEAFRFLQQFVGSIIDVEQRNVHARGSSDLERACAPQRMNSGETGTFADHHESILSFAC